jgi:hypothetical protein
MSQWTFRAIGTCARDISPVFLGREGLCCALGTNINKLSFYNPYGAMNFMSAVGNCVIANNCTKWRCVFEGLSQDGKRGQKTQKISAPHTLMKIYFLPNIYWWTLDSIFNLCSRNFSQLAQTQWGQWPNPIDQITKKTPNPKISSLLVLIEFIDWRYS